MFRTTTVGRLAGDPEVKYLTKSSSEEGTKVAKFGFITKRGYKKNGEDVTDFVFVTCFGNTANFAEGYLSQGYKVIIDGNFQTGSYVDKDGKTQYTFELVADNIEIVSAPKNKQGQAQSPIIQQGQPQQVVPQQVQAIPQGYYMPQQVQAIPQGYYMPQQVQAMPQGYYVPQGQPQQVVPQQVQAVQQEQPQQAEQLQSQQTTTAEAYATPVEDDGGFH